MRGGLMHDTKKIYHSSERIVQELEEFSSFIEQAQESRLEMHKKSWSDVEFGHALGRVSCSADTYFSDEIEGLLESSGYKKQDLLDKIVNDCMFVMCYEELSSPFTYNARKEGEIDSIQVGGEIKFDVSKEGIPDLLRQLKREDVCESLEGISAVDFDKDNFTESCSYETSLSEEEAGMLYDLVFGGKDHVTSCISTEYDVVRVLFDVDFEENIKEMLEKSKKKDFNIDEDEE
jgi:hypothetical protein